MGLICLYFLLFLELNLIRRDDGFGSLDGGWYHYRAYFFWIIDAKCREEKIGYKLEFKGKIWQISQLSVLGRGDLH